jgi:hypothetical protein
LIEPHLQPLGEGQHSGLASIKSGPRCSAESRHGFRPLKTRSRPFRPYVSFHQQRT